jgi:hypothetical protein
VAQPTGFVTHKGVRIYLIDIEGMQPDQVSKLVDQVAREIRAQPPGTVRTLTHVKNAVVSTAMVERLRWLADGNKPFVKHAAIAGLTPTQRVILNVVKSFTGRDWALFADRQEALDHLARLP